MGRQSLTILQLEEIIYLKISVEILQDANVIKTIFCNACKQFWYSIQKSQFFDFVLD